MATVTTGTSGDDPSVVIILDIEGEPVEHLSPDEARRLAVQLIETAHRIEHPKAATEWP